MRRRSSIFIISAVLVLFAGTGCLKDTPSTDLTNLGSVVEMMYPNGAQSNGVGTGLEFFGGDIITTGQFYFLDAADTVWYYGNLAGPNLLSKALTTGVAVDDSALQDNFANDGITYSALPDSCYKIVQTSGTIPAGKRIDTFALVIYSNKIDLTQNYGLPIQLTAPGYTVASNFSIMYLHTIGAPIGGIYNQTSVIYYDSAGAAGTTPPTTNTVGPTGPTVFTPLDNADVEVPSGDSTGISYIISFTNNNGVAAGPVTVTIDPNTIGKHIAIAGTPTITADLVNKIFTINMAVSYGSDSYVYNITDTYTFISKN
jgi:Domain of unknown function (DUF1735)